MLSYQELETVEDSMENHQNEEKSVDWKENTKESSPLAYSDTNFTGSVSDSFYLNQFNNDDEDYNHKLNEEKVVNNYEDNYSIHETLPKPQFHSFPLPSHSQSKLVDHTLTTKNLLKKTEFNKSTNMTPQHLLKVLSKLPSPAPGSMTKVTTPPQPFKNMIQSNSSLKSSTSRDDPFSFSEIQETPSKLNRMNQIQQTNANQFSGDLKNDFFPSPSKISDSQTLRSLFSLVDRERESGHSLDLQDNLVSHDVCAHDVESEHLSFDDIVSSPVFHSIKEKLSSVDLSQFKNEHGAKDKLSEDLYILLRKTIKEVKETVRSVHDQQESTRQVLEESTLSNFKHVHSQSEEEQKAVRDIELVRGNIDQERQELARLQTILQTKIMQQRQLSEKILHMEQSVQELDTCLQSKKQEFVDVLAEKNELANEMNRNKTWNWVFFGCYVLLIAFVWSEWSIISNSISSILGLQDHLKDMTDKIPY